MKPRYKLNNKTYTVDLIKTMGDKVLLGIDDHALDSHISYYDNHRFALCMNGVTHDLYVAQDDNTLFLHLDGKSWQVERLDEFTDNNEAGNNPNGEARAPMPGMVVEILVAPGQFVQTGQCIMLIESMKLQIQIPAPTAGVMSTIYVNAGDNFAKSDLLANIAMKKNLEA
ncbi:MAG: biotin/lipoyl-binding protein [Gammaproteobacteria bacterium]|nr:biotin/lipoyl-binding protein [Gammaproteobacteria bacterium]